MKIESKSGVEEFIYKQANKEFSAILQNTILEQTLKVNQASIL